MVSTSKLYEYYKQYIWCNFLQRRSFAPSQVEKRKHESDEDDDAAPSRRSKSKKKPQEKYKTTEFLSPYRKPLQLVDPVNSEPVAGDAGSFHVSCL